MSGKLTSSFDKDPNKLVSLAPDEKDLYIASHICLKPCPFCGSHPCAMGSFKESTGIYQYKVQCTNYHCWGGVFQNSKNRDEARDLAIEQWQRREKVSP